MKILFKPLSIYTAAMVAGIAFFFLLHHVGNQLPFEVAKQRFQVEFDAAQRDAGYSHGFKNTLEYCELSSAVMAGARGGGGGRDVKDALLVRAFVHQDGYCRALREALGGGEPDSEPLKTRYWWGSKALYAIALRALSVYELSELTKTATRLAYALLAVAVLLLSPKALAAISPLILLGAFHSGIDYFGDVANGMPYAWTVLSAAVLAFLMRFRAPGAAPWGRARFFSFVTGMVSSYLWLGDGHTFLAVTLIGLIAYFGHERAAVRERVEQAVRCIGLYLAGFLICYGLGLLVKAAAWGSTELLTAFLGQVIHTFEKTDSQLASGVTDFSRYLDLFHELGWSGSTVRSGGALTPLSLCALVAALLISAWEAYRARPHLLPGILWIVALMLVNVPNFIVHDDYDLRTARFLFVMHGLCFSCLILAFLKMKGMKGMIRSSLLVAGVAGVYLSSRIWVEYADSRVLDSIEDTEPVIRSRFDVYYADNRLIYTKEQCTEEDVIPRFFLHVIPADPDDLEKPYFNNLDFFFIPGVFRNGLDDGRCVTIRRLPGYAIDQIRTGQYFPGEGPLWKGEVSLVSRSGQASSYADPRVLELIEDTEPVIRSRFDVYYADSQLIYTKEQCTEEDVAPRFFLHVIPADPDDLEKPYFNNLDFAFIPGVFRDGLDDGRCVTILPLPDYAIEQIRTGQYFPGEGPLWKGEVSLVSRSGQASSYADPRVLELIEDTEPVIRSRFDVYYADNRLIYTKEQCTEEDVTPRFFLHVIPADPADLEKPNFNNLDFAFIPGVFRDGLDDGRCVTILPLPDYAVERIRTGQYFSGEEPLWKGEVSLVSRSGQASSYADPRVLELIEDTEPVIRSRFDVYYADNRLIYTKEQCTEEDVTPRFFLHVIPADPADFEKPSSTFNNLDFNFIPGVFRNGLDDGRCVTIRPLPDYAIERIRTGQYFPGEGPIWKGEVSLVSQSGQASSYADPRVLELIEDTEPVIRSRFDVYYADNQLIYTKEQCTEEDVTPRFFLHVIPADPADLEFTYFNNLDFEFIPVVFRNGLDDGRCVTIRPLPDYAIEQIRTGQYFPGEGPIWKGEVSLVSRSGQASSYADPRILELIEDTEPVIRSRFDVYYADSQLIYTKEQCTEQDVAPRFFLHVISADPADLEFTYYNSLDFEFIPGVFRSGLDDGRCVTIRPLPDYAIERIKTGQYFPGEGPLWKGEVSLVSRSGQASSYADPRILELIEDTEPVIRSRFDVYYADNRLIYTKEQCTEEDVAPRFFLHVIPMDRADFEHPYYNSLDFEFIPGVFRSGLDDGRCVTTLPLPDYAIERIRTGQFFIGEDPLWKGEVSLAWRRTRGSLSGD